MCGNYFEKTGRRLTFEYSLVGGVNDTREDAEELIALAKPLGSHVNLIPVNPIKVATLYSPIRRRSQPLKEGWKKAGDQYGYTVRRRGRDIDGAVQ